MTVAAMFVDQANSSFARGDFDAARQALDRAFAAGCLDLDALELLVLLHLDAQSPGDAIAAIDAVSDRLSEGDDPASLARLSLRRFVVLTGNSAWENQCSAAAIAACEAAAFAGGEAWEAIGDPAMLTLLESSLPDAADRIAFAEQLGYAPAGTGLRSRAVGFAHAAALGDLADPVSVRAAERLLHALDQRDLAYQLERQAASIQSPADRRRAEPPEDPSRLLRGLRVTVAGGHPALRAVISRDLRDAGVLDVRDIPPRWEGSRTGRDIAATIGGTDAVVVITRQIAHSTSDQVRVAAVPLGIPVLMAEGAGVAAVRRALLAWRLQRPV